jgi:hypothetical protein
MDGEPIVDSAGAPVLRLVPREDEDIRCAAVLPVRWHLSVWRHFVIFRVTQRLCQATR